MSGLLGNRAGLAKLAQSVERWAEVALFSGLQTSETQWGVAASSALLPMLPTHTGSAGAERTAVLPWWRPLTYGNTNPGQRRLSTIPDAHCALGPALRAPPPWSQAPQFHNVRQKLRLGKGSLPKITQLQSVSAIRPSAYHHTACVWWPQILCS